MIKTLYDKYFQKSRAFLFPLLGIPRRAFKKPFNTYLSWEDHFSISDQKLILQYPLETSKSFETLEKRIKNDPLFEAGYYDLTNCQAIYVFSLEGYTADVQRVIDGKYSKLGRVCKRAIQDHLGEESVEYAYMDTFLYPEKHFEHYSELLNIPEDILRTVGELCDPADVQKESLQTTAAELTNLENKEYICRTQPV